MCQGAEPSPLLVISLYNLSGAVGFGGWKVVCKCQSPFISPGLSALWQPPAWAALLARDTSAGCKEHESQEIHWSAAAGAHTFTKCCCITSCQKWSNLNSFVSLFSKMFFQVLIVCNKLNKPVKEEAMSQKRCMERDSSPKHCKNLIVLSSFGLDSWFSVFGVFFYLCKWAKHNILNCIHDWK